MNWNDIERVRPGLSAVLERQVRVSKLVGFGFGITLADSLGIAAPVAVLCGLRALFLLKTSEAPLAGAVMAWWCILVGSLNGWLGALQLFVIVAKHFQH